MESIGAIIEVGINDKGLQAQIRRGNDYGFFEKLIADKYNDKRIAIDKSAQLFSDICELVERFNQSMDIDLINKK